MRLATSDNGDTHGRVRMWKLAVTGKAQLRCILLTVKKIRWFGRVPFRTSSPKKSQKWRPQLKKESTSSSTVILIQLRQNRRLELNVLRTLVNRPNNKRHYT